MRRDTTSPASRHVARPAHPWHSDVRLTQRTGELVIRHGNGDRRRPVPLSRPARAARREALADRAMRRSEPSVSDGPLWISRTGEQMSVRSISKLVPAVMARGHRETAHALRHTIATRLVRDHRHDLVLVADVLGHTDIKTTATTRPVRPQRPPSATRRPRRLTAPSGADAQLRMCALEPCSPADESAEIPHSGHFGRRAAALPLPRDCRGRRRSSFPCWGPYARRHHAYAPHSLRRGGACFCCSSGASVWYALAQTLARRPKQAWASARSRRSHPSKTGAGLRWLETAK
jgi:hypothetical protein